MTYINIGFFITARLKSSRLKQKILLDLNGKTVLDRVIERCKVTSGVDGIVLCTSTNSQDSVLNNYAKKHGILYFEGSEDDVLKRLLDAAHEYNFDAFVSITADNSLFSLTTSGILADLYRKNPYDFGFTTGLPIGVSTSLMDTKALDVAVYMKKKSDTEIWGPFVNRPDFFNLLYLNVVNSPVHQEKRLTIDYIEDLKLFLEIYRRFGKDSVPTISEVFELLTVNPELWKINEKKIQRWPTHEELKLINNHFDKSVNSGLKYASTIGKELRPSSTKIDIEV